VTRDMVITRASTRERNFFIWDFSSFKIFAVRRYACRRV